MVSKRTGQGDRDEVPFSEAARKLGEAIKARRLERGLTVYALAKATSVSQEGLRKIELGLREPNWRTMVAVSEALGLSLDELAADLKHLRAEVESPLPTQPTPKGRPKKPATPAAEDPTRLPIGELRRRVEAEASAEVDTPAPTKKPRAKKRE